ncbi:MAG: glutathione peroxidase [Gammaproteobacteria bacterium]|nr:glutathione peroxidase [Gammaproteobacteria bacterium]
MKRALLLKKLNRKNRILFIVSVFIGWSVFVPVAQASCNDLFDFSAPKLRSSEPLDFCEQFAGKALLVVNTASQCGYTSQFADLEKLYQNNKESLAIVGFPSNDFNQEYDDASKVADVCYANYGVTFSMVEPSSVKGDSANALFKKLAAKTGKEPSWNFNKYLISADGNKVIHFPSSVSPTGDQMASALGELVR